jgi:hypothetical protein
LIYGVRHPASVATEMLFATRIMYYCESVLGR